MSPDSESPGRAGEAQEGDRAPPSPDATRPPPAPAGPPSRVIAAGFIAFAALALWGASRREFWRNEVESALILRETSTGAREGAGFSPTLFGEPYLERPPLFYWLCSAAALTGVEPRIAYRVPSLAFALLGLWLTFRLGRELFDRRIGFLAMVLQGTTVLYFLQSTWLEPAFPFTVLCQLALTGFALASGSEGRAAWRAAGWLGLAGASLTLSIAGAVALVFFPLVLSWFLDGGLTALRSAFRNIGRGFAWLLFPVLVAPWYIWAGVFHGRALLEQHVMGAHVMPFLRDGIAGSPLYYLLVLLVGFLPWTIFLPLALLHAKDRRSRPGERLCFYWFFPGLIGLSLLPSRNATWLLFCWPALSLLIPAAFYETAEKHSIWEDYLGIGVARSLPHLLRLPLVALAALLLVWSSGLYRDFLDPRVAEALADPARVLPFLGVAAVGAAGALLAASRVQARLRTGEVGTAVFESARAMLFFLLAAGFALSLFDPIESPRRFVEEVRSRIGDSGIATYGDVRPPEVSFYLDRTVEHYEELDPRKDAPEDPQRTALKEFMERPERVYLLMSSEAHGGFQIQFEGLYSLVHPTGLTGPLGTRGDYVLLSNRPAS